MMMMIDDAIQQLMTALQRVQDAPPPPSTNRAKKRARDGHFVDLRQDNQGSSPTETDELTWSPVRQIPWELLSPFEAWEDAFRSNPSLMSEYFEFCVQAMSTSQLVLSQTRDRIDIDDHDDEDKDHEEVKSKKDSSDDLLKRLTPRSQYDVLVCRTQAVSYLTKGFEFLCQACTRKEKGAKDKKDHDDGDDLEDWRALANVAVPELIVYALPMVCLFISKGFHF